MICIPIIARTKKDAVNQIKKANKLADFIELRLDYLLKVNKSVVDDILDACKKKTIVTLRSRIFTSEKQRLDLLKHASKKADYVDLEDNMGFERKDFMSKIIISHHNFKNTPDNLIDVYKKLKPKADIVKIVTKANCYADNVKILELLNKSKNVIAFCMGKYGMLSRILCLKHGSLLTFASLKEGFESAEGQIPISQIQHVNKKTMLLGIIGDPIEHSLSPEMQNAALCDKKVNAYYMRFHVPILKDFMNVAPYLDGFNVTLPHKEAVMQYLDKVDKNAELIGAVNTVVNKGNKLLGFNTDFIGIEKAVKDMTRIKHKTCLIFGAGGAAKAAAYIMKKNGSNVIVTNRTFEKALELGKQFEVGCFKLEMVNYLKPEIIINATSIGYDNKSIVPKALCEHAKVVFDFVYKKGKTKLIKEAEKECKTVDGKVLLVYQGVESFKLWTGKKASSDVMFKALK